MNSAAAYLFQGEIVIATERQTTTGLWITESAAAVPKPADPDAIGQAVLDALASSRQGTPHPADWSTVVDPVPGAAGAKNFKAFMQSAKHVAIEAQGLEMTFRPSRNLGPKEGFEPLGEVRRVKGALAHDIGTIVMAALAEAA